MMYPRLKLLRRLLSDDGSIWISIDDIEVSNLRLLLDEVFGVSNFVADVLSQKKYAVSNDHKTIAPMHDHILVYRKSPNWQRNLMPRSDDKNSQYRFTDSKGLFRISDYTCNKSADERPNLYYPIINPNTGHETYPKRTRVWGYSADLYAKHVSDDLIYWGKDGKAKVPSFKRYKHLLKNADGVVPSTWWTFDEAGHTDEAKKEIRSILSDHATNTDFITPKPTKLIGQILIIGTNPNDIILDSFAGSGTTAHAVLKLNAADGGNRKFILIEQEDYAETITAERVRRVMSGYGEGTKAVAGLGGSFDYYEIGDRLFLDDGNLNEAIGTDEIRKYIAFSEGIRRSADAPSASGAQIQADGPSALRYLLGVQDGMSYYFYYEHDHSTTLDLDFLATLDSPGRMLIYADRCLLSKEQLTKYGIIFKKIPRDITRF